MISIESLEAQMPFTAPSPNCNLNENMWLRQDHGLISRSRIITVEAYVEVDYKLNLTERY